MVHFDKKSLILLQHIKDFFNFVLRKTDKSVE